MTPRRALSYSDTAEVRKPDRLGKQRGPTTATVIDPIRDATPEEWRITEQLTRSTAARQGWDSDGGTPLAEVVSMIGLDER